MIDFKVSLSVMAVFLIKIVSGRVEFVKWELYFIKQCTRVVVRRVNTVLLRDTVVVIGDKKLNASLESCDYEKTDCNVNTLSFVGCANVATDSFKDAIGDVRCRN